jgi:perosamine synthetase
VLYQGGRPVFADVQPGTLNIDPEAVQMAVSERTKAIIAVDFAGQPADLDELRSIAADYGLLLIEDAAHALGATYKGKSLGGISDLTTFSTHPVKLITTGEGGMITTNNTGFVEKMRSFRNHGISTDHHQRTERGAWFYEMEALGYNYRLSDLNCALGLSQLKKLDAWVSRRRTIASQYDSAFAEMSAVEPLARRDDSESAYHLYVIQLNLDQLTVGRKEIFSALRAENIGVNVHYIPVYWHPYYRNLGYTRGLCPVVEAAYERLITLPLFPAMTDGDVRDVIEAVSRVTTAYSAQV